MSMISELHCIIQIFYNIKNVYLNYNNYTDYNIQNKNYIFKQCNNVIGHAIIFKGIVFTIFEVKTLILHQLVSYKLASIV